MLNVPHIVSDGCFETKPLAKPDRPNIIVESIKPCEDEERAYVVRLYEAEGTRTNCKIRLCTDVFKYTFTNMLEEPISEEKNTNVIYKQFRPFEIVTVKAYY